MLVIVLYVNKLFFKWNNLINIYVKLIGYVLFGWWIGVFVC